MADFKDALNHAFKRGKGTLSPTVNTTAVSLLRLDTVELSMDNNYIYSTDHCVTNSLMVNGDVTIIGNLCIGPPANGCAYQLSANLVIHNENYSIKFIWL